MTRRNTDLSGGGMESHTRIVRPTRDTDAAQHTADANVDRLYVRRQSESTDIPSRTAERWMPCWWTQT